MGAINPVFSTRTTPTPPKGAIALTVAVKERSWTGTKFAAIAPNAL
ncbi:MAG: hypothetical protein F6J93_11045 [Oscillatoria sp. SIO1A7]|nr:hypothetical protein [Oscillatoria sp. SIO1A7]